PFMLDTMLRSGVPPHIGQSPVPGSPARALAAGSKAAVVLKRNARLCIEVSYLPGYTSTLSKCAMDWAAGSRRSGRPSAKRLPVLLVRDLAWWGGPAGRPFLQSSSRGPQAGQRAGCGPGGPPHQWTSVGHVKGVDPDPRPLRSLIVSLHRYDPEGVGAG